MSVGDQMPNGIVQLLLRIADSVVQLLHLRGKPKITAENLCKSMYLVIVP